MTRPDIIRAAMIEYVLTNHVSTFTPETIPLDQSLVELGVLDSYGVVELVAFLETTWGISIADSKITREKMGSINKMVALVEGKLLEKPPRGPSGTRAQALTRPADHAHHICSSLPGPLQIRKRPFLARLVIR